MPLVHTKSTHIQIRGASGIGARFRQTPQSSCELSGDTQQTKKKKTTQIVNLSALKREKKRKISWQNLSSSRVAKDNEFETPGR